MDDLARLVRWVAQDLDDRGYPYAAVVRRAAQSLAAGESADDGGCGRCGSEVVQPRTGRRRKFCFACSPRKTRENAVMVRARPPCA